MNHHYLVLRYFLVLQCYQYFPELRLFQQFPDFLYFRLRLDYLLYLANPLNQLCPVRRCFQLTLEIQYFL
jgi:hypothetical protein